MHAIKEKDVQMYQDNNAEYLDIIKKAYLEHGTIDEIINKHTKNSDHNEIELKRGKYKIIHQREYDAILQKRRIQDWLQN